MKELPPPAPDAARETLRTSGVRRLRLKAPPGRMLDHACVYLVGEERPFLVDGGYGDANSQAALAGWLRREAPRGLAAVLLTHGHSDHAGGLPGLLEEGRGYCHARAIERFRDAPWASRLVGVEGGQVLETSGVRLEVIATPGHAPDHLCFYWGDRGVLFAGDLVLAHSTTLVGPPEGRMGNYLRSLERVAALGAAAICPGHGPVVERPAERVAVLLRHRRRREEQVMGLLGAGAASPGEMARTLYRNLDARRLRAAERMVTGHLEKLREEGKVVVEGEGEAARYRLA